MLSKHCLPTTHLHIVPPVVLRPGADDIGVLDRVGAWPAGGGEGDHEGQEGCGCSHEAGLQDLAGDRDGRTGEGNGGGERVSEVMRERKEVAATTRQASKV